MISFCFSAIKTYTNFYQKKKPILMDGNSFCYLFCGIRLREKNLSWVDIFEEIPVSLLNWISSCTRIIVYRSFVFISRPICLISL